jgi:membrane fusion protein, heavy metal efflux system
MDLPELPTPVKHPEITGHHEAAPKPGRPLSQRTQMILLALCLVFAGGGVEVLHAFEKDQTPVDITPAAAAVDTSAIKLTDRQWTALKIRSVDEGLFQDAEETDGRIAIDDDLVTPVFSPYSGRVTRLIARPGDTVAKGDPLFAIQATEMAQAQNDLITAAGTMRTARAQLNLAIANEKRQHELYLAQGAAQKDWQQSQVDLATAQGGMNSATIALASVRNRLRIFGKSDQDIDQIEDTSDILHLNADTTVPAPIAGTIVQRQIGLGQNIISASSGASNPVYMIGDLSKVWLIANAREEDAPFLHKGDPVEVSVFAYPNRVFKAHVAYVAASIDPSTHRLSVRTEVENPRGELKPEMFARFRIITGEDAPAPSVPEAAIIYEGDAAHVWVANDATKTLAIRQIKVGRHHDGLVEALAGLKAHEKIVTAGAVFIDRAASGD